MDDELLRNEIAIAFEYSYLHDAWVTPLDEALLGLTAEQAQWSLGAATRSIWEIVLHLALWNENIVERIASGKPIHPSEGSWPALPDVRDEVAWEGAKTRLASSLLQVRTLIEGESLEKICGGPYGLADLLCRSTHLGYHLGQITKLREFMETFEDP